jgi:hypothetical protein
MLALNTHRLLFMLQVVWRIILLTVIVRTALVGLRQVLQWQKEKSMASLHFIISKSGLLQTHHCSSYHAILQIHLHNFKSCVCLSSQFACCFQIGSARDMSIFHASIADSQTLIWWRPMPLGMIYSCTTLERTWRNWSSSAVMSPNGFPCRGTTIAAWQRCVCWSEAICAVSRGWELRSISLLESSSSSCGCPAPVVWWWTHLPWTP